MTVNYFLYIKTPPEIRDPLRNLYRNSVVPGFLKNNQIESVHLFTRYIKGKLSNDDEDPPELTLQIDFGSIEGLYAIFASSELTTLFPLLGASDAIQDVFRPIHYPIAGEVNSLPRRAPMSYNVRYYQPIDDAKTFVEFYLTHHPQILAYMPLIRNVLCYLPVQWDDQIGFPNSGCIIGNEVVFDSFEDLQAANRSDVRVRLREDMQACPVPAGPSSHSAFMREDFFK